MDLNLEEDDPDAIAMAEAMGFSGFGSQRPTKRKFNANADAAVSSSPQEKRGGNVSKTGANNAPLGMRRQLHLPPPTSASLPSLPGRIGEEIDLDDEREDKGEEDASEEINLGATAFEAKKKLLDALQTPGGFQSEDADSMVAQPPTLTIGDNGPPGLPSHPTHHQSFQREQDHQNGRGGRGGSRGAGHVGEGGTPWWKGYYDARMNENPWEKLEKERGLLPRGTWIARNIGQNPVTVGAPSETLNSGADAAAELLDSEA